MNMSFQEVLEDLLPWLLNEGLQIVVVIAVTLMISKFLKILITKIVRRLVPSNSFHLESEEEKREDTLIAIFQGFFSILIWVIALVFVLEKFGVPVGPLITGAGIVGVAVGFGSQSLVRDVINGIFIIVENQFRIGDVVEIAGRVGTVEGMTLRVTRLRQLDGTIHYVPNGEIKIASNQSKDYSMVDLLVNVGYKTEIDHLESVINRVGEELANDEDFKEHFIETPKFLRIEDLSDYSISARILSKVYPKHQFLVAGELRRRLKLAFEAEGIDIPYPTRVVHNVVENIKHDDE
jgi:small-conductance mechanosensitive channel